MNWRFSSAIRESLSPKSRKTSSVFSSNSASSSSNQSPDLDFLFEVTAEKSYNYHKLVKYPVLSRDLAVLLEEEIAVGDIYQSIKDIGGAMLKNLELFDIYQGDQIKDGYKSAAFELKFQAADRTLTDQEVNERFNQIVKHLKKEYSAEIRGN